MEESLIDSSGNDGPKVPLWKQKHVLHLLFEVFCAVLLTALIFTLLTARDRESLWYFPLLGIAGATCAMATPAGGGMVFLPVLLLTHVPAQKAATFSVCVEFIGMGVFGSIAWLTKDHNAIHFTFLIVAVVGGWIGVLIGMIALPLESSFQVRMIFDTFALLVLVQVGYDLLMVWREKQEPRPTEDVEAAFMNDDVPPHATNFSSIGSLLDAFMNYKGYGTGASFPSDHRSRGSSVYTTLPLPPRVQMLAASPQRGEAGSGGSESAVDSVAYHPMTEHDFRTVDKAMAERKRQQNREIRAGKPRRKTAPLKNPLASSGETEMSASGPVGLGFMSFILVLLSSIFGGWLVSHIGVGVNMTFYFVGSTFLRLPRSSAIPTSVLALGWTAILSFFLHAGGDALFGLSSVAPVPYPMWLMTLPGVLIGAWLGPFINRYLGSTPVLVVFFVLLGADVIQSVVRDVIIPLANHTSLE